MVMDFATSVVWRGKFRQHLRHGLPLPGGWANEVIDDEDY